MFYAKCTCVLMGPGYSEIHELKRDCPHYDDHIRDIKSRSVSQPTNMAGSTYTKLILEALGE